MADIVDTFFNRGAQALPKYVGAMPSIIKGVITTVVISVIGIAIAMIDREKNKESENVINQTRYLLVIVVVFYIANSIGEYVRERDYLIRNIKANSPHYANVFWLKKYMESFRSS